MKRVFLNFIYQSLFQVLTMILPLITIPIISRALGAEGIGLWGYTNSIVNYFMLVAGLGMASYAVREIAYVKNDKERLSEKFWELQLFNMLFSSTVFSLFTAFVLVTNQHYLYLIQALIILGVFFDISWLFQGVEDFKQLFLVRTIIKLLAVACIILFIHESSDLWLYALIMSVSQLISALALWKKVFKYIDFKKVKFRTVWGHFRPALNFFLLKISATIFTNIGQTALGLTSTVVMVGYFTNSLQLIVLLGTIIGSLNQVMLSRMSILQKEGNEDKFIKTLQMTIHIQLFFTIALMFGIIAMNEHLIGWFFGSDFYFVKKLIPILAPIIVFQQLHQGVADQFLVPKNEIRFNNLTMIIATTINVIVSLAFIPFFQVYGAIFGFLLGQIFLGVSRSFGLVKMSTFQFEWVKILKWLLSGIVMLIIIRSTTNNMPVAIITTLSQGIIGLIVYMSLTWLLNANPLSSLIKE